MACFIVCRRPAIGGAAPNLFFDGVICLGAKSLVHQCSEGEGRQPSMVRLENDLESVWNEVGLSV
jgi:hypothetical protein